MSDLSNGFVLMKNCNYLSIREVSFTQGDSQKERIKTVKCSVFDDVGELHYGRDFETFLLSDPLLKSLEKLAKHLISESGFIQPFPNRFGIKFTQGGLYRWSEFRLEIKTIAFSQYDPEMHRDDCLPHETKIIFEGNILDYSKEAFQQYNRFRASVTRFVTKHLEKDCAQ